MGNTRFVDTNIFLRYLIPEDPGKTKACLALFQQVQRNQLQITTSEAVMAEVVYVLSSKSYTTSLVWRSNSVYIRSCCCRALSCPTGNGTYEH